MSNQQTENATIQRQTASLPASGPNRSLDRMATLCQLAAIVLSALAAVTWLLILAPFQGLLPGFAPPAISMSLAILVLSLVSLWIKRGNLARRDRVLAVAAVSLAAILSLASIGELAAGRPINLDSLLVHSLFPGQADPGSPVSASAAFLPLLVAAAELLLLRPAAGPRARNCAAGLGGFVMMIGATICMGYLFSAPILYGGRDLRVAFLTGAALFFLGGSFIAIAGPGTFLTSSVVGNSLQARLLRVFLPLVAGLVLAQSLFHVSMSNLVTDHAFAVAVSAILFLFVTGITVVLAGRSMGLEFDAALDRRQRAETAACLTAAKYQSLFDVESDALFLVDQETGSILEANAAASNLYGYSHQELLTMHHLDLAARPDQTHAAVEEPVSAPPVRRHRARDGSVIPVEIVSSQLAWEGRQVRLVAVRDVTDRQRAQQALRESQRAMATLLTNLPGMAYRRLNDRDGTMQFVSQGCLALTGYTPEDLTNNARLSFNDLTHVDDREPVWQQIQAALRERQPYELLYRILTAQGAQKWVWEQGTGIFQEDGSLAALEGFIADVTEREQAQAGLRQTSAMLAGTLASLDEVVLLIDSTTRRIIACNAAAERTLGYRPDEIIGQTTRFLHISQDDFEQFRRRRLAEMAQGGPARLEWRTLRKDGSVFQSEHTVTQMADGPWQRPVVVSVIRDISLRKQAEEQMTLSLKEKEVLLREIHHRVKNNLQVIASLLSLQMQTLHDSAATEVLRDSQGRIKAMSLIHAKLYESRDLARVDFGGFVRDLGAVLFRSYLANPGAVQLQVNAGSTELNIDTVIPCSLIVNELLANCVRHAFPDGRAGRICVDMSLEDERYTLRVADNGVGFPTGVDFRNTASLGLQLVNMLTEQLEGTVEMNRQDGTEFVISFKCRPPRTA